MNTTTYTIYDFLANCGGRWHNAIFIPCGACGRSCVSACRGFLMTADHTGRPRIVSVLRYESITGQKVEPSDCVGKLPKAAFQAAFQEWLIWMQDDPDQCFLRFLDAEVSASPGRLKTEELRISSEAN